MHSVIIAPYLAHSPNAALRHLGDTDTRTLSVFTLDSWRFHFLN
jgi:hypothetical protein